MHYLKLSDQYTYARYFNVFFSFVGSLLGSQNLTLHKNIQYLGQISIFINYNLLFLLKYLLKVNCF